MNEARKYTSQIMQEVRNRISPEKKIMVQKRMRIAVKIDEALKAKGWTQKQFAEIMGKRPSEVSKWLSGTHNFTLETISHIETYLGITLIVVPDEAFVL